MIRHNRSIDEHSLSRYIAELLAEKQKLAPFMQVLPCTSRLLNQGKSLLTHPLNLASCLPTKRGIVIFLSEQLLYVLLS